MHGLYVRRMIPKPGDPDREVLVAETFHEQTDEELTKKEVKKMESNDQEIQTILMGLPKDIYAAIDSCETAQEIWFTSTDGCRLSLNIIVEVNELRAERLARTHDPLVLMANSNNPYNYLNYMQQPMLDHEDISDPTTTMNMELVLMVKAFKLNYSTLTNNNQRISSNPRNKQIAQPVQNLVVRNVGNQNGLIAIPGVANQNVNPNGNGNVVAAWVDTNGDLDEIEDVNANCILMANLQQYTKILDPITKPHMLQQNNSNVIFVESSVEHNGGTVDQYPTTIEETRSYFESLYNNLSIEVEKVNSVNCKMKETNAELTTELATYKNQEKCFEINQEKYDKLETCYQKSVYQEQYLTKNINALHLSSTKTIMTLNEEIANLNNQLSKEKSTVSYLQQEKKKLKSDFKIREDEFLDKQIQHENKIKEFDNIWVKMGQSIHMLSHKPDSFYYTEQKMALGYQNPYYLKQAQ
ncbi:hypothetical protein Tco_1018610 [Tanacetum coccineum]|uniref:Uncharacterized protein n=1 Tax=Tanacetum coccineum TaxID=301880 RepID=A0ABQ5FUV1_9ASTR